MRQKSSTPSRGNRRNRGFVLITMAVASVAVAGMVGMAVDAGRLYIAKNETQAYCDAAALAAALALDGTTTGIANAHAAVANSTNTWNFNTVQASNPVVTFATALAGPWVANPNPATGYGYARVRVTVTLPLYFVAAVTGQKTQDVVSSATAAQVPVTSFPRGLAPYTAVTTNPNPPNFGLEIGRPYSIQWPQFNSS